ncbi:MAG: HNH endonuclease, partial [Rhodococcus sp.]|nr:HNH endonuclease [Rhodococcus sp. (in: high G+C Gram-positive bacteria)]
MNAALTDTAELTDTAALINEETQGSTRSDVEQLGSEICALAGQIAAATARFLTLLSKFDEDRGWTGPGLHSCAHWLSWKCGMSLHTGR